MLTLSPIPQILRPSTANQELHSYTQPSIPSNPAQPKTCKWLSERDPPKILLHPGDPRVYDTELWCRTQRRRRAEAARWILTQKRSARPRAHAANWGPLFISRSCSTTAGARASIAPPAPRRLTRRAAAAVSNSLWQSDREVLIFWCVESHQVSWGLAFMGGGEGYGMAWEDVVVRGWMGVLCLCDWTLI